MFVHQKSRNQKICNLKNCDTQFLSKEMKRVKNET